MGLDPHEDGSAIGGRRHAVNGGNSMARALSPRAGCGTGAGGCPGMRHALSPQPFHLHRMRKGLALALLAFDPLSGQVFQVLLFQQFGLVDSRLLKPLLVQIRFGRGRGQNHGIRRRLERQGHAYGRSRNWLNNWQWGRHSWRGRRWWRWWRWQRLRQRCRRLHRVKRHGLGRRCGHTIAFSNHDNFYRPQSGYRRSLRRRHCYKQRHMQAQDGSQYDRAQPLRCQAIASFQGDSHGFVDHRCGHGVGAVAGSVDGFAVAVAVCAGSAPGVEVPIERASESNPTCVKPLLARRSITATISP